MTLSALLVALTLTGAPAPAPQKPDTAQPFSAQDTQEAREALKMVGQAFGVTQDQPAQQQPQQGPQKKEEPKKTMADVADKALDLTAKFVSVVVGKVEQAAPMVMRIMVRQQYAKAFGMLIAPWGLFVLTIIAASTTRRFWTLSKEEQEKEICETHDGPFSERGWRGFFTFFVPLVACIFFGVWGVGALSDSAMYLVNPEYYAIKDLLQMLLKPGSM